MDQVMVRELELGLLLRKELIARGSGARVVISRSKGPGPPVTRIVEGTRVVQRYVGGLQAFAPEFHTRWPRFVRELAGVLVADLRKQAA